MSTAVIFPGQGSQSVGMLGALAEHTPLIGQTFAEASDLLGYDLWALVQSGPAEKLADTRVTQPVMFVSGIAVWRGLRDAGMPMPAVVAGHSLGEFSALVAAGALAFTDGLNLVRERARLMAAAVPEGQGGMAALLGLDDDAVVDLCASISGERIVEAVNFNAPGQVAISGHIDALERALEVAKSAGARRAVMLPVSVPNHSSLMRQAGESLVAAIDAIDWQEPVVPVVQNADASAPANLEELLTRLRRHVYSPVYWSRSVQQMRDVHAVERFVESGPGKVLAGLGKRIDRNLPVYAVEDPTGLAKAVTALRDSS